LAAFALYCIVPSADDGVICWYDSVRASATSCDIPGHAFASLPMVFVIISLSRDQTKRSDSSQQNCFVESDRRRDQTKRSDSSQQNCFVESDRSRVQTKRSDSTKLFGRVASFDVITLYDPTHLNSTSFDQFWDSEHFPSFSQLSCVGS